MEGVKPRRVALNKTKDIRTVFRALRYTRKVNVEVFERWAWRVKPREVGHYAGTQEHPLCKRITGSSIDALEWEGVTL